MQYLTSILQYLIRGIKNFQSIDIYYVIIQVYQEIVKESAMICIFLIKKHNYHRIFTDIDLSSKCGLYIPRLLQKIAN